MPRPKSKKAGTESRNKILEQIYIFNKDLGWPPSTREIMEFGGISSTSVVHYHLEILVRTGFVLRGKKNATRSLALTPIGKSRAKDYFTKRMSNPGRRKAYYDQLKIFEEEYDSL